MTLSIKKWKKHKKFIKKKIKKTRLTQFNNWQHNKKFVNVTSLIRI